MVPRKTAQPACEVRELYVNVNMGESVRSLGHRPAQPRTL